MNPLQRSKLIFFVFAFFFLIGGAICAKATYSRWQAAAQVVKRYCQMDAEGKLLEGKNWPEVQKLTTWEDGPGWDSVYYIRDFKILNEDYSTDQKKAEVEVEYHYSGEKKGEEPYHPLEKTEKVKFKLVKDGSTWKITEPQREPRLYQAKKKW